jgi:hypothetical protein
LEGTAGGSTVRKVVVVVCLLAIVGVFGGVARQSWNATTATARIVEMESWGADMMHPMTSLLSHLVTAQSAAVRGEPVDQSGLREVLDELAEPDSVYGEELRTSQRLSDLTRLMEAAFTAQPTGREAYATYSALVDLAVALIHVIGDTSHLIHDPDLDSYYLMDAALVHLPSAMVYAGRASDLVALATGEALTPEELARAAVARFNVSHDAEQVSIGLDASIDFTARSELGTNIADRLGTFRAAADQFAPPTMLQDLATEVDADSMAANAERVFAQAASLSHLLLGELQELLKTRSGTIGQQRRFILICAIAGAVFVLTVMWLVLVDRLRRSSHGSHEPNTNARGIATVGPPRDAGRSGQTGRSDLVGVGTRRSGHAQ